MKRAYTVGMRNIRTVCMPEKGKAIRSKKTLTYNTGSMTVKFTAIFASKMVFDGTGTEHMIQRFFPSKERDGAVVEVMLTNSDNTSGMRFPSSLFISCVSNCLFSVGGRKKTAMTVRIKSSTIPIQEFNAYIVHEVKRPNSFL